MPLLRRPSSPARPAPELAPLVKPMSATAAHRWDVAYWTLFACLCFFGIAPVWISDLLPLLDAGSHLHLMKIIHDFGDNALYQHHYKEVHAIVPYLSYYKAVDWLQYFTDVEQANRIVLSLCLLGIPLAAHALLKALHHNRWLVLGVFPWMLNSDFFMGFFNYLMSIPVFLLVLAAHVHFLRRPSWRGGALVGGLLVFLAVTHYLLWGVSLALLPLLALIFGLRKGWLRGISWGLREVAIVIPSIAVLLPWFLSYFVFADGVKTPDQVALHGSTWFARLSRIYSGQHLTPLASVSQLFDHLFNRFAEQPIHIRGIQDLILRRQGELISSTWLLGIALWILGAVKRSHITMTGAQMKQLHDSAPDGDTVDERVQWPEQGNFAEVSRVIVRATTAPASDVHGTSYIGWALALVTAAYFILPQHLNRPIILYGVNFRLVEVLGIMAVIALPVCPLLPARHVRGRVWLGTVAMLVASVMMPIYTSGVFMLARTEFGSIREAFHTIPPNRSVLTLRMKRQSQWLEERIFSNIGEYYAIFRGGYVPYSFADSSSKPVITRPEATMPAPVWYDHTTFGMKPHGKYYDYIAVYRGLNERTGTWELGLRKWHKIYQRDHWQVFRNPAKATWPPPSPLELARIEAIERAMDANMELLGLGAKSTLDLSVDGLLELWNPDLEAMADPKAKRRKRKKRKRRRRKLNIPRPQNRRAAPTKKAKPARPTTRRMGEPAPAQPRAFALPGQFNLPAKMPKLRALHRLPSTKLKLPPGAKRPPSEEVEIGVPPHASDPNSPVEVPIQGRAARGADLGKPRAKPGGWMDLSPAVRAFK